MTPHVTAHAGAVRAVAEALHDLYVGDLGSCHHEADHKRCEVEGMDVVAALATSADAWLPPRPPEFCAEVGDSRGAKCYRCPAGLSSCDWRDGWDAGVAAVLAALSARPEPQPEV